MELTKSENEALLKNLHHDLHMAIRSFSMHRAMYETVQTRGIAGEACRGSRAFETIYLCTKEVSISALGRILDSGGGKSVGKGSLFEIANKSGLCKSNDFDAQLALLKWDRVKDKNGEPQEDPQMQNVLALKKWRDSLVAHRDDPETIATKLSQVQDFDFDAYESLLKYTYLLVDDLFQENDICGGVTTGGFAPDETPFSWELRKGKQDGALLTNALFPPDPSKAGESRLG